MEILFEALLELLLEGTMEAGTNKRVPKPIRYFILALLALFFGGLFIVGLLIGISQLKESVLSGVVIIVVVLAIGALFGWSMHNTLKKRNNGQ